MRFCHSCQQELDSASLASGRCASCGTVLRTVAQRTVEDKKLLHQPPAGAGQATEDSIDLDIVESGQSADAPSENKLSGPQRKSPTISDRIDRTIEFQPDADDNEPSQDASTRDSSATIDSAEFSSPRRTLPIDSDLTIDLASLPPEERKRLESEWGNTLTPGSRQGQTIRQKDTITSHRSSLQVKSRFIRERKKNGTPQPPASPGEVPDYELLEVIGEGGMGVVYMAEQSHPMGVRTGTSIFAPRWGG
jgi:serine/threonine protein kinase